MKQSMQFLPVSFKGGSVCVYNITYFASIRFLISMFPVQVSYETFLVFISPVTQITLILVFNNFQILGLLTANLHNVSFKLLYTFKSFSTHLTGFFLSTYQGLKVYVKHVVNFFHMSSPVILPSEFYCT